YPFVLTPLAKAELMRHENLSEQRQELHDAFFRAMFVGMTCPYLIIEVRREHVVRDALVQLWGKSTNDLKKALKVRFVGEEGVDEGGVTREFLSLVVREIFNSEYGMFRYYEDSHLYWFRLAPQCDNMINEYRLIGQLIGLAAYNSAMVGINFPRALYRKLCGRRVRLCDLAEFEPELARGLQMMLDYETDDPDEFELLFGRNFVMEYDHFGEMVTQPLVHGGESIPLTLANRQEYVNLYVEMVLSILVYRQYEAFREGFHSIMGSPHQLLAQNLNPSPSRSYLIESLEPHELELIICGHNYDNLDLHELESVCQYDGGYNRESSVICNFWDVVHNDFTVEQRRLLLKFVTGTDRVPVGGFSKLTFVISKNGVGESDRLPTAHTCFNVMLLCEYETRETLKDRLLTAINNAEGFGMH
ncbi:HECT-domain-containing protein, partial [Ramicandelaber brevisporus]